MKLIAALAFIMFFSLAGCQIESRSHSSPQPESVELNSATTVGSSVDNDSGIDPPLATIEVILPEPTKEVETTEGKMANANVLFVKAQLASDGTWTFAVTVEHEDTGWEDYADGWDVVLPDGNVIKPDQESPFTRLLLHPHETEQPFTRSQNGIVIPSRIEKVSVRAHDLVDGYGGKEVMVDLAIESGPDFEVVR